jgi:hypothetical protein
VRLSNRIVLLEARGATHRRASTPPDLGSVWNALSGVNQQIFNQNITTYNSLLGSRNPSINPCATASARRLCGN